MVCCVVLYSIMVVCAVYACKSRSGRKYDSSQIRFFAFPSINSKVEEDLHDLVLERRSLWVSRIARKDLTLYDANKISCAKVCSKHFVNGAPSVLRDTSNPDWAPSINLGHDYFENEDQKERIRSPKNFQEVTPDYTSFINESDNNEEISCDESDDELDSIDEETVHENEENGHDKLKYFIFGPSKSSNSSQRCSVSHEEALTSAETLLKYMENQENADHADLILIRGYIKKIKENMEMEE